MCGLCRFLYDIFSSLMQIPITVQFTVNLLYFYHNYLKNNFIFDVLSFLYREVNKEMFFLSVISHKNVLFMKQSFTNNLSKLIFLFFIILYFENYYLNIYNQCYSFKNSSLDYTLKQVCGLIGLLYLLNLYIYYTFSKTCVQNHKNFLATIHFSMSHLEG